MYEYLLNMLITVVSASIVGTLISFITTKRMENKVMDYLYSQDALELMAQLGAAFASGAMTQLKFGHPAKGIKVGPFKIPQTVIDAIITKGLQQFGVIPKALSEGTPP